MMSVEVKGFKSVIKTYKRIGGNLKKYPRRELYNLSRKLASIVKTKASVHTSTYGPGHNTPLPLAAYVRGPIRTKKGYRVFMDQRGRYNLPRIVEFGTQPHEQPLNPWFGGGKELISGGKPHPGATPKYYWRDSFEELRKVSNSSAKKVANKILRGK